MKYAWVAFLFAKNIGYINTCRDSSACSSQPKIFLGSVCADPAVQYCELHPCLDCGVAPLKPQAWYGAVTFLIVCPVVASLLSAGR